MTELKPLYDDHTVEVPRRVWNQVENKINNRKERQKYMRLKAFSAIAACFVIASLFSYVKFGFNSHNPNMFASNETYKSMIFEDLEHANAPIYDYQQVQEITAVIIKNNPNFAHRVR